MELLAYTYIIVTIGSLIGGFTRWLYPNVSDDVAEQVKPIKLNYTLALSFIIGLALSTYFYIGISGSNVELGFILQLSLLAAVLVFKNIDRLHKIKFDKNI
ncbi:hypothetical protein [Pseudoalteromonas sp. NC201]|uniref:hypothetical protein n=1 Tax=Pseudoalteromonas sp. NC201 TaxID=1514074 RepID=UPI000C7C58F8|nr:hypothetical protein [Pseudoalteromonas sp. NC201]AUJ68753.1 hypothetical protein PNC201_02070 [Pseudoalteromonas sp. NC201]